MTRPRKKSRRKRDSNPGPSALEADALTTRPTGRYVLETVRGTARRLKKKKKNPIVPFSAIIFIITSIVRQVYGTLCPLSTLQHHSLSRILHFILPSFAMDYFIGRGFESSKFAADRFSAEPQTHFGWRVKAPIPAVKDSIKIIISQMRGSLVCNSLKS